MKKFTLNFYRTLYGQSTDTNHEESLSAISGDPGIGDTESDDSYDEDNLTEPNRSHYISPEELSGNSSSDKSDIWYIF